MAPAAAGLLDGGGPAWISPDTIQRSLSLADAITIAREHNPAYRQTLNGRNLLALNIRRQH